MEELQEYYELDENGFPVENYLWGENEYNEALKAGKRIKAGGWGSKPLSLPKVDFVSNEWVEGGDNTKILEIARANKLLELSNACEQEILGYFQAVVRGVTYYFSYDEKAQLNFNSNFLQFIEGIITTCYVTAHTETGEIERLILSKGEFISLFKRAAAHRDEKLYKLRDVLQPKIKTSTKEEINKITW